MSADLPGPSFPSRHSPFKAGRAAVSRRAGRAQIFILVGSPSVDGDGAGRVPSYTYLMRCTTVIHDVNVSTLMIIARTQPFSVRPNNAWGAQSITTRSGRCSMPTFASMPSDSARARVYEVMNEPMIPAMQEMVIHTLWWMGLVE